MWHRYVYLKVAWSVKRISGLQKESDGRFGLYVIHLLFSIVVTNCIQINVQILENKSNRCNQDLMQLS